MDSQWGASLVPRLPPAPSKVHSALGPNGLPMGCLSGASATACTIQGSFGPRTEWTPIGMPLWCFSYRLHHPRFIWPWGRIDSQWGASLVPRLPPAQSKVHSALGQNGLPIGTSLVLRLPPAPSTVHLARGANGFLTVCLSGASATASPSKVYSALGPNGLPMECLSGASATACTIQGSFGPRTEWNPNGVPLWCLGYRLHHPRFIRP